MMVGPPSLQLLQVVMLPSRGVIAQLLIYKQLIGLVDHKIQPLDSL